MLQICSSIEDFFQLVMGIPLDLSPIVVHKSLKILQSFVKKCLKLVSYDWNKVVCILFLFVLLSAEANLVLKKRCSKKNLVSTLNLSSDKIILTLLIKVILFHLGFFIVYVKRANFQKFISGFFIDGKSLSCQNGLENLL